MNVPYDKYANRILLALSRDDLAALVPHLEAVRLVARQTLASANQIIERIYFPESGLISTAAVTDGATSIGTGLIGPEGMTGLAVVMGDTQSPEETRVLVGGEAHRIEADTLASLLRSHPTMHRTMLRFANVYFCQVTQMALANATARIDIRLARFLLMAADRLGSATMSLTHEQIASLMSVRRPGVTDSFHRLEGERVIQSRRSLVFIRDREGLEAIAGGAYGVPEREYQRHFGVSARQSREPLKTNAALTDPRNAPFARGGMGRATASTTFPKEGVAGVD